MEVVAIESYCNEMPLTRREGGRCRECVVFAHPEREAAVVESKASWAGFRWIAEAGEEGQRLRSFSGADPAIKRPREVGTQQRVRLEQWLLEAAAVAQEVRIIRTVNGGIV